MDYTELYTIRALVLTEGIDGAAEILGVDSEGLEMWLDFGIGSKVYVSALSHAAIKTTEEYELSDDYYDTYHLMNNLTDGQYSLIYDVVVNGRTNEKGKTADITYFLEPYIDCDRDLNGCSEFWTRFREFYKG